MLIPQTRESSNFGWSPTQPPTPANGSPLPSGPYPDASIEPLNAPSEARKDIGASVDELLASTLARLKSFVLDPTIRRIITQQAHSLDLAQVIESTGSAASSPAANY